jgi:hypothetical protein
MKTSVYASLPCGCIHLATGPSEETEVFYGYFLASRNTVYPDVVVDPDLYRGVVSDVAHHPCILMAKRSIQASDGTIIEGSRPPGFTASSLV